MIARQRGGLFQRLSAHNLQHRTKNLFLVGLHRRLHIVEQVRANKISVLIALQLQAATVEHKVCALIDTHLDVAFDLGLVSGRDHRAIMRIRIGRDADFQVARGVHHALHELVAGLLADGDGHRQRHAAFARRAIGRADNVLYRLLHVAVGHDDAVVLCPAHGLHAFAVCCASGIDILCDVGGPDEADGLDVRMRQDGINSHLVAIDHVQHAFRCAGLEQQFAQAHRHRRVFLRRLEDESVTAGNRHSRHPARDHGGKIERRDTGHDAQRLTHGIDINAGACAFSVLALLQMRDTASELDHVDAALNITARIRDHFAMLGRQQLSQLINIGFQQALEFEHHSRAALGVHHGPGRERL